LEIWTKPRGTDHPLDADRALDPGRVLLVEDDAAVRLVCAVNLEAAGLRVLQAADGLEGLEQARFANPDIVLTDVSMPRLDGFGLAERLRRDDRTRRIPVIFLSAELGHANAQRALALGAVAYLTKPFDPSALAAFVLRELAAARAGSSQLAATGAS
jgi:two-component system chemotaxis response regulator CheY